MKEEEDHRMICWHMCAADREKCSASAVEVMQQAAEQFAQLVITAVQTRAPKRGNAFYEVPSRRDL